MRKLNTLAAVLTIVGGLNWGLVGLFKFDLVAAIFGGMQFGEVNVASRIVYTLVGLSALYLASQLRTLIGTSEPTPTTSVTALTVPRKDPVMLRLLTPRRAAVAGVLGLALLGAACSSNNADTSGTQTPAASATTASPMAASGPFGAACSTVPASGTGSLDAMAQDPVATAASNNPELSTLVTAVTKADLVDTLNTAQGITVFAPTNDAFAAVPKPTLDKALGDPKGLLTTVLTYHVVQGQLTPDQLAGSHETLQGSTLHVSASGPEFKITGNSSVVCGNIQTANATVYLIDQVLLPNS